MIENLKHLVLVRHGESEGDVRREAWRQGLPYQTDKTPENEELTELGFTQSAKSGEWINKNLLLGGFAISAFSAIFKRYSAFNFEKTRLNALKAVQI